jgi:hypothetical protein
VFRKIKRIGQDFHLLTARNHNPAIECIRDCYFPIRNVVVIATPPTLAVSTVWDTRCFPHAADPAQLINRCRLAGFASSSA